MPVALGSSQGKWLMTATILASAMAFIDGTALNVALPALQKNLNASAADLFWILNAYLLMLASLILIGGSLGDKLGRKKIFMLGILIFIVGSAACGFATTVFYLITFRVIQGIGGALMIPGSLALISSSINENQRGKAIGTWSAATTAVTMGGPIVGGALADAGLWRYIFFINVPIGVAALLILLRSVKETRDEDSDTAIDYAGAFVVTISLALLTYGFLKIPARGFNDVQVIISLAAGGALLSFFILIERKNQHPMMPLHLFSNRNFSGTNLLTFFLYAALGGGILFLSLNLVQVQGYSQLQSGLTFLPFTILMITITRFAGSLSDRYGPRWFLVLGPAIVGVGLLILSFVKQTQGPADFWRSFFPGILIFGLGMAFTVSPLTATVMGSLQSHFSGTASGINNAVTRISNVFANAVFGALAVLFFTGALQKEVDHLPFDVNEKQLILKQAANLGNAKPPAEISEQKAIIENAFHASFISSYQNIMRICAALAFLAAVVAFLFIRNIRKLRVDR
ncbi:MAG TPA: MFS transporter [Parafilimonas sp.]|nr:MFS transporter [Parafilimonas sp.]